MNKKKSIKNILYSLSSQLIVLMLGLIVPRIILVSYGSDTNGFMSTVTQIFTYMALLEAGIGQATRNELYAYVNGEVRDRDSISRVMTISHRSFRSIACIYAIAVLVLALVLPFAIRSDLNYWTIAGTVLLEGATGVVSFWFVQNWSTILTVDGKQYINSNIELVNKILCYTVKIVLALLGTNIVLLQLGFFAASVIKLMIYYQYMKKHYAWINYHIPVTDGKLKDRNAYIVTEIAWTVFSSTDMIVLSMLCSTKEASVYSVYNMIFVALHSLLNAVYMSLKFNLGQAYHSDIKQYEKVHDAYNSIFMGTMSAMMSITCLLCLPFVTIYTRGINDVNYINAYLPMGFCLIQILSWSRMISGNLLGLAGYAKQVSMISLIEALMNLSLSLILVHYWGIVGVLMATVVALPLKLIYCNWMADRKVMNRSAGKTIRIIGGNMMLFVVFAMLSQVITMDINSYSSFFMWGVSISIIMFAVFILLNVLLNQDILNYIKRMIKNMR